MPRKSEDSDENGRKINAAPNKANISMNSSADISKCYSKGKK
jgi:hypothetical protein